MPRRQGRPLSRRRPVRDARLVVRLPCRHGRAYLADTMARLILALLLALAPGAAFGQDIEGSWALRISDATVFRFDISRSEDGEWRGTWTRPESFASNGAVFARMTGSEQLQSMAGIEFAGDVELSFDDPRPEAIPDIFRFRHLGEGQAQLTYVGTDLAPFPLVQVAPGTPLGPFAEERIYDRDNAQTEPTYDPGDPAAEEPMDEPAQPARSRLGEDFLEGF